MKQGQETNQIWTQEAGTHDTHDRGLTAIEFKKSELMALHNHAESHLFNIYLKKIKYLGIVISKDPKIREKHNLIDMKKVKIF